MTLLANSPVYRDRRTWLLGVHRTNEWNIKSYAITASGHELSGGVFEAALRFVERELQPEHLEETPLLAALDDTPRFGFLILHEGSEAVWLLLDLWIGDILHHHLYRAPLDDPASFETAWQKHSAACVWELAVIHHERNAWVEHVLSVPGRPRYDSYLATELEIKAA